MSKKNIKKSKDFIDYVFSEVLSSYEEILSDPDLDEDASEIIVSDYLVLCRAKTILISKVFRDVS